MGGGLGGLGRRGEYLSAWAKGGAHGRPSGRLCGWFATGDAMGAMMRKVAFLRVFTALVFVAGSLCEVYPTAALGRSRLAAEERCVLLLVLRRSWGLDTFCSRYRNL